MARAKGIASLFLDLKNIQTKIIAVDSVQCSVYVEQSNRYRLHLVLTP